METILDLDQIMKEAQDEMIHRVRTYYKTPEALADQSPEELFCVDVYGTDIPFSFKTEIYNDEAKAKEAVKAYRRQRKQMGYSAKQFQYTINKRECMADAKIKSHLQYYDLRDKPSIEESLTKYYEYADTRAATPDNMFIFLLGWGKTHDLFGEEKALEMVVQEFGLADDWKPVKKV